MKFLSFSRNHDFSICLYNASTGFFRYVKREREENKKHAKIDIGFLKKVMLDCAVLHFKLVKNLIDKLNYHGHKMSNSDEQFSKTVDKEEFLNNLLYLYNKHDVTNMRIRYRVNWGMVIRKYMEKGRYLRWRDKNTYRKIEK